MSNIEEEFDIIPRKALWVLEENWLRTEIVG